MISLFSALMRGRSYSGRRVQWLPSACGNRRGLRAGRTRSTSSVTSSARCSAWGKMKIMPAVCWFSWPATLMPATGSPYLLVARVIH
jgi:hypothetical protein